MNKKKKSKGTAQKIRGLTISTIFLALIAVETYYVIIEPLQNGINLQTTPSQYWSLAIPVFAMVTILSTVSAWIGFTMYRTPEPIKLTYEEAYELALEDQEKASGE